MDITAPPAQPEDLLQEINHATAGEGRLNALKTTKTIISGNELRKKSLLESNALGTLTTILKVRRAQGKAAQDYDQNSIDEMVLSSTISLDDDIARQAVLIIGILANSGPAFVYPIVAAGCIPLLFDMLAYPVPALRLAVLETLVSIADNLPLDYERTWPAGNDLANTAFSEPYIGYLIDVLQNNPQPSTAIPPQGKIYTITSTRCFKLAANLISKICIEPHHKLMLCRSGAINALAYKIASFVVAQGLVLPGADRFVNKMGSLGFLPLPTNENTSVLIATLRAITVIIADSRGRAEHFLTSPGIVTVFPVEACKTALAGYTPGAAAGGGHCNTAMASAFSRPAWMPSHIGRDSIYESKHINPIDALLPPFKFSESSDSLFPSLSSAAEMQASLNFSKEEFEGPGKQQPTPPGEIKEESPFISWLFYIFFTGAEVTGELHGTGAQELRVVAGTLLLELFDLRLLKEARLPVFATIVMPILTEIIGNDSGVGKVTTYSNKKIRSEGEYFSKRSRIRVDATVIVARLIKSIRDRRETQIFRQQEEHVVQVIIKGLQRTFIPRKEVGKPAWNPQKTDKDSSATAASSRTERPTDSPVLLGPSGLSKFTISQIKARQRYLFALTNLAVYDETNRAKFAEREVLNCVLNSMKAPELEVTKPGEQTQEDQPQGRQQNDGSMGNTDISPVSTTTVTITSAPAAAGENSRPEIEHNSIAVIHAACMAARALCRSPKLMRTALKEADMSKPAIKLLYHADQDIKLAATAVLCNLSLDFSPMKQNIMEDQTLDMLCAQARSNNIKLQIESFWALKHIVLGQSDQFRMMVLNKLRIDAILNSMGQESRAQITQGDTGEPVSEQANIISCLNESDIIAKQWPQTEAGRPATLPARNPASLKELYPSIATMTREEKLNLESDIEYIKQTRKVKAELVEQSIDLVRNLICGGDNCAIVLDHIIAQCGDERLFSLITQQLDTYVLKSDVFGDQPIEPPDEIVLTISYALINFSACSTVHANIIVSHKRLMGLIVGLLSHRMRRVRCNASWTLYNIISTGRAVDLDGCKRRAAQVIQFGAKEVLHRLQQEDRDVDVRERAGQALTSLREMLEQRMQTQDAEVNGNANGHDVEMEL